MKSAAFCPSRTGTLWSLPTGTALALVSSLIVACGTDPSPTEPSLLAAARSCEAPAVGSPPSGGGHPALTTQEAVPLHGTPFAVAISPTGVTYVTQAHAASAARADLPSTSFSTSFPVGELPSQVRMSPDGGTAYVPNQDSHTITYIDVATNQTLGTATVPAGSILTIGSEKP